MTLHLRVGGAQKECHPHVRVGGSWRTVQEAFVRVGGGWRRFYVALTASATPNSASGSRTGLGYVTTNSVTVSVSGGSGSYSYAWSTPGFEVVSSGSPTTAFRFFADAVPTSQNASATCTVTDTVSGATATVSVPCSFTATP